MKILMTIAIVAIASFAYADEKGQIRRYQLVSGETQVRDAHITEVYKIDTETGQVWRYKIVDPLLQIGQVEPVKTVKK
jgi:hypothetical protein